MPITLWAKRFGRNVLGETFWAKRFGRKFFLWNRILHLGLGAGLGWAGLGLGGWGLGWGLGWVRHALVETVPGRPGTPKQVVREGSTLRYRLERIGYLNIASICSSIHEWGLNTMPHPIFFGVLKGSEEGACDGAPSAASFAA